MKQNSVFFTFFFKFQALKLENDIVDDRLVKLSNRLEPDQDLDEDQDEEADKALAVSRTR